METQNVTLALPKELIQRAKVVASQRNISLSKLLTRALEEVVDKDEAYEQARTRHLDWLEHGADLGTNGKIDWTRDELHERK